MEWAMCQAGVLVVGSAVGRPCSLSEAGALGAKLAWHSGYPLLHTRLLPTSWLEESGGLGPGKACLGEETIRQGERTGRGSALICSGEGAGRLKSSGKDWPLGANSLSSVRP